MSSEEIIKLWKQGLSKNRIALIYQRRCNQQVKLIRLELVNRHWGKMMTNKEALSMVESVIYRHLREKR